MATFEELFLSFHKKLEDIQKDEKLSSSEKDKAVLSLIDTHADSFEDEKLTRRFFRRLDSSLREKFIGEPSKQYEMIIEKFGQQLEPVYFWLLNFARDEQKIKRIEKIVDTFSASELSNSHRQAGQSIGAIENQISNSLRTISVITRDIFKIVHELKILDQWVELFEKGRKFGPEEIGGKRNHWEITLKGRYIDVVEGGAQNPGSIFGLARAPPNGAGFVTLPEYFFLVHVFDKDNDSVNKALAKYPGITRKVKEKLGEKLQQYIIWRETSERNYKYRKKFQVAMLKQHYVTLKMNMNFLKPYLHIAKRMRIHQGQKDSPDLLLGIEQAMLGVELLAFPAKFGRYNAVVNLEILFRTAPKSEYNPRAGGQITSHVGRSHINLRARAMTDNQVLAYKVHKSEEDFEALAAIDDSFRQIMDNYGDVLEKLLEEEDLETFDIVPEAKKQIATKDDNKKKVSFEGGALDPFVQLIKGFGTILSPLSPKVSFPSRKSRAATKIKGNDAADFAAAEKEACAKTWIFYNIYKKGNRHVSF